jgi:hypothetical protein
MKKILFLAFLFPIFLFSQENKGEVFGRAAEKDTSAQITKVTISGADTLFTESSCDKWKLSYSFADNTRSDYRVNAELEVTMNNGVVFNTIQTPTTPPWTGQQNQWLANIITEAANNGITLTGALHWANSPNGYTDPNNGFFFPPYPEGTDSDVMSARFMIFTSCFGDPYITGLRWKNTDSGGDWIDMDLDYTDSPEFTGWRCFDCVDGYGQFKWVNEDGITELVPEADIPPLACVRKCTQDFPPTPTDSGPNTEYFYGCDNGVTDADSNLQPVVAQVRDGEIVWLVADQDGGLLDYNNGDGLIGEFADCETGELIDLLDCEAAIAVNKICYQEIGEGTDVKVGVQSNDCDSGAADEGDENCTDIDISLGSNIVSINASDITADDSSINNIVIASQTATQATVRFCWTQTGNTTPTGRYTIPINTTDGLLIIEADSTDPYAICNNDDETFLQATEVIGEEIMLSELCYEDCPNKYQDADGNDVDIEDYVKCNIDATVKCVTPANIEELCKRSFEFIYDNGRTSESSTNDCGARINYVRFNETFVSQGWNTGVGVVGVGTAIGPYTGWGTVGNSNTQLQSWEDFGVANDPYGSTHSFDSFGAPTWRAWTIEGCNPDAQYGIWNKQRNDGCIYSIYPVNYTEKIEKIWRTHEVDCDGNPVTRYWNQNEDGITYNEVKPPEDIDCYVDCGYPFKPVIMPGAESPCTTTDQIFCDRVDANDSSQDVQYVLVKDNCDGKITINSYTLNSYNNATNPDDYVDYAVVGDVFICGTNDPPAEPLPDCERFELHKMYTISSTLSGTIRNREWHDTAPAVSPFPTNADAGRNFRLNHDFSLPTTTDNTVTSFRLNDTDNTAAELDIQVLDAYIQVDEDMTLRYTDGSEGYWAVELGECCGDLELLNESGGFFSGRQMVFTIPSGLHRIRIWNIDAGGSNSSATFGYSEDGGISFTNDNTPPGIEFSESKITESCELLKICEDSGAAIILSGANKDTVVDLSDWYVCPQACTPSSCKINIVD